MAKVKGKKGKTNYNKTAVAFSMPALIFQVFFGWLPLIVTFIVAFQKFYVFKPSPFVGLIILDCFLMTLPFLPLLEI